MKRLTEKILPLTAAICLMAMLGAFVSLATNHMAEETTIEIVELEEFKAITEQSEKRRSKQRQAYVLCVKSKLSVHNSCVGWPPVSFSIQSERDHWNGIGGYLRV